MRQDAKQPNHVRRAPVTRFWDWVDERQIVRRSVLYYIMFLAGAAGYYGWEFAHYSKLDGMGTSLVIAAFTAPATILVKAVIEEYFRARDISPPL